MEGFHRTHFGRERCDVSDLPRHRHIRGYLTLILPGSYVESGDGGRFRAGPGDLLLHRPFEAHLDRFAQRSADLVNLPLPCGADAVAFGRIADPDAAMRLAEHDPAAAASYLVQRVEPAAGEADWPDLLAAELMAGAPLRIGDWARLHSLAPATVSRGFRQV